MFFAQLSTTDQDRTILLVDSNKDFLEQTARSLSAMGLKVRTSKTGAMAIKLLKKDQFVILVISYQLSDMYAPDVIKALTEQNITPPFMLLSAEQCIKEAVWAMKHNSFDYLAKDENINQALPEAIASAMPRIKQADSQKIEKNQQEKNNQLLNTLLDNLSIGVFMVEAPSGKPLFANETAKKILGKGIISDASKENLNITYNAFKEKTQEPYPPKEMPILMAMNGEYSHVDDMIIRRPVEDIYLEVFGSPIKNEKGEIWASLVSFTDITSKKEYQKRLHQSQELLALITENSHDSIWTMDSQLRFTYVTPSTTTLLGYATEEFQTLSLKEFIHPDDFDHVNGIFQKFLTKKTTTAKVASTRIIHKKGTELWVEFNATPLFDETKNFKGVVGVTRDITRIKKTEQELIESKDLLAKVEHLAVVGGWQFDVAQKIMIWTDETYRIHGLKPEKEQKPTSDLIEKSLQCYPEENREIVNTAFTDCIEKATPYELEFPFSTFDGRQIWIKTMARPIFQNDKVVKVLGNIIDITQRVKADKALLKNITLLKQLLAASDALARTLNLSQILSILAQTACDLIEVSSAAIYLLEKNDLYLGATIPPLPEDFPEHLRRAFLSEHPSIIKAIDEFNTVIIDDTQTAQLSESEEEIIKKRNLKSLAFIPLIGTRGILGVLILGTTDKPRQYSDEELTPCKTLGTQASIAIENSRFYKSFQDELAERILAEAALRQEKDKISKIATSVPGAVCMFTFNEEKALFSYVSPAISDVLGIPVEELLKQGFSFKTQVSIQDSNRVAYELLQASQELISWHSEFRYSHPQKGEIWIDCRFTPSKEKSNHIVWYGIFFDVSDLKETQMEHKKLQDQLTQAQKLESIGRLAGGVAHDFNNMLGVIMGRLEMAMENLVPSSKIYKNLEEADKATRRSAALTRQLLAFARKQTVHPQVLSLNKIVEGMLKMLRRLIGENINLLWLPAKDLGLVKMDPAQLDQVVVNLCINAKDAISENGKITIETHNAFIDEEHTEKNPGFVFGDFVKISVSDNGCGMTKDTQLNIFEPFFTTKEVGKGTGLGLPTVYGIVKQNKGFINVYSEPNTGSTFSVYIPRHYGDLKINRKKEETEPTYETTETILLVEDEASILEMAQMMLESQGYKVYTSLDPESALEFVNNTTVKIDLLITDVVMPKMNGKELALILQKIYPDIKMLFMSGYTADVIAHHGVLETGVHFIQKPFLMKEFRKKIQEVLQKK